MEKVIEELYRWIEFLIEGLAEYIRTSLWYGGVLAEDDPCENTWDYPVECEVDEFGN